MKDTPTFPCPECKGEMGHGKDCSRRGTMNTCPETINGWHGEADREGKCPFCRKKIGYGAPRVKPQYFRTTANHNSADVTSDLYDPHNPNQQPDVDPHEEEYYDR